MTIAVLMKTSAKQSEAFLSLWESSPAPNLGPAWDQIKAGGMPYDADWEQWSYPLGNGYLGACVFGRTDTERIQITEKTLHNQGPYGNGGITSFAELQLIIHHGEICNYRRSLNLEEAIAHVSYEHAGVVFSREYFVSYPDNVMVIRLAAEKEGAISLDLMAEIPYRDKEDKRVGTVMAAGNLLTISGTLPFFNTNFEGQISVMNEGGIVTADTVRGSIEICHADSIVLLIAAGTNYNLSEKVFTSPNLKKCDSGDSAQEKVSERIMAARSLGYAALRQRHLQDYQKLFGRVSIHLNSTHSTDTTSVLLNKYKEGDANTRIEELMFHYGRYLLIASSREKTLPSGLQGAWSQYFITPWSGGYWHNINVQMNYWGSMSANLAESFEAYIAYFKAYLPKAREHARNYVQQHNPDLLDDNDDPGWIVGTNANAYDIQGPGGHSGPGTGGFTSKLLVEYYRFTQDETFLKEVAYPAIRSLSAFYSKALVEEGKFLLVKPSASPEQRHNGEHYVTTGCTFDQGFVWENYSDTLTLAKELGVEDEFIERLKKEITRLDPINVGATGQIKEYREEEHYSDIGDPQHRHISHLCPLYPGSMIVSAKKEWMKAASKTLDLRGDKTTGWAMAHRMNCRARLKEGEKAYNVFRRFISERTAPNLWTLHPPFQIDGNFGTIAGVVEMLLQSHEGFIEILPALPQAWHTGSFKGLVARGNFVVDAEWHEGRATRIAITSRSGGVCHLACPEKADVEVRTEAGNPIQLGSSRPGLVTIETTQDQTYIINPHPSIRELR